MATYAENARKREIASRRRTQDARDAVLHRQFDLQAQDITPKSDRPHFAVVGEGSRAAQENFRLGWERIFSVGARRSLRGYRHDSSGTRESNQSSLVHTDAP